MSESATVIKEIQAKFTANITDYRNKMGQLMSTMSNMTKNLDAVKRTAASAMNSPSASTQKLGRSLDATASKLQKQRDQFTNLSKAGERTAQQMEQLTQRLAGMANTYSAIKSASASFDLSTPLQKQADAAKAAVEQIDVKIESLSAAMKNVGKDKFVFLDSGEMLTIDQARAKLEQLSQSGVEAAAKFDRLKAAINGIGTENLGYASAKGMDRLKSKIGSTADKLNGLGDKLSSTSSRAQGMTDSMQGTKRSMDGQSRSLSKSTRLLNSLKDAFGKVGGAAKNGLSSVRDRIAGVGSAAKNSTSSVNGLWKAIKKIAVIGFTLKLTKTILGRLRTTLHDYLESNEAAAASVQKLRDGLAQALAPAINVVINLLNRVMPYLIGIADAVASLITNIFGTGWTTVSTGVSSATNSAKDSADKASKSAGKASDKVDDLADSTKKAAEKQKEYNKLIAGFDEITKLEDQDSSDSSDKDKTPKDGSGKDSGSGAKQKTAPGTEGIAGKLPAWLDAVAEKLAGIWAVFQQAWKNKGAAVIKSAKAAFNALKTAAADVGNTIYDVFTDGTGQKWIESILDLFRSQLDVVTAIVSEFDKAWKEGNNGKNLVKSIFNMFSDINRLLSVINDSFAKAFSSGVGERVWSNILQIATNVNNTIGSIARNFAAAWKDNGNGERIWLNILNMVNDVLDAINKMSKATADWAKNLNLEPAVKAFSNLTGSVENLVKVVSGGLAKVYNNILLPLAKWVIEDAGPKSVDVLRASIDILRDSLKLYLKIYDKVEKLDFKFFNTIESTISGSLKALAGELDAIDTALDILYDIVTLDFSKIGKHFDKLKTSIDKILPNLDNLRILVEFFTNPAHAIADVVTKTIKIKFGIDVPGGLLGKIIQNIFGGSGGTAVPNVVLGTTGVSVKINGKMQNGASQWRTDAQNYWNQANAGRAFPITASMRNNASDQWNAAKLHWVNATTGQVLPISAGMQNTASQQWADTGLYWIKATNGRTLFVSAGMKNTSSDQWKNTGTYWSKSTNGKLLPVIGGMQNTATDQWNSTASNWHARTNGKNLPAYAAMKNNAGTLWKTTRGNWDSTTKTKSLPTKAGILNNISDLWRKVKNWWGERALTVKLKIGSIASKVAGWAKSGWDALNNLNINIPAFASGGVVDKPTYALAGEDGPEAFVPLKNNAEWTGVVANLITRRMSTMPTYYSGTSPAAGSTSGNQNDLMEMLMLVRELRADVAALKSNGIQNSVTVYTQLDGTTVAKNTINHINKQSRVTGKNPLGSYI